MVEISLLAEFAGSVLLEKLKCSLIVIFPRLLSS